MDETQMAEVKVLVDQAAAIARMFLPHYTAYILIGSVVAKAAPQLYVDVLKLLKKVEPTTEEKRELARKLQALANPEQ